jgi:hypothetical protein
MSAVQTPVSYDPVREDDNTGRSAAPRRLPTETKASFKTTEFFAMVALIAGILISAAVITASSGHPDRFVASDAWLYVAIVGAGYMISRGLAKSGTRTFHDEHR